MDTAIENAKLEDQLKRAKTKTEDPGKELREYLKKALKSNKPYWIYQIVGLRQMLTKLWLEAKKDLTQNQAKCYSNRRTTSTRPNPKTAKALKEEVRLNHLEAILLDYTNTLSNFQTATKTLESAPKTKIKLK